MNSRFLTILLAISVATSGFSNPSTAGEQVSQPKQSFFRKVGNHFSTHKKKYAIGAVAAAGHRWYHRRDSRNPFLW